MGHLSGCFVDLEKKKKKKKRVQNQVENVGKVKEEGRPLKGYFGHVIKCAIFYAPLTL